jgi:hypothetical protein
MPRPGAGLVMLLVQNWWNSISRLHPKVLLSSPLRHLVIRDIVIPPGEKLITDWVMEYFSSPRERNHTTVDDALRGASPVTCTDRMPFILQYSGHSLTIIGYEISKTGTVNLLSFNSCESVFVSLHQYNNVTWFYSLPSRQLRNFARARFSFTKLAQEPRSSSSIGLRDWVNSVVPSNSKKRSANHPPAETKDMKRIRSDKVGTDDEVIIISDSSDAEKPQKIVQSHKEDVVNGARVLGFFRLDPKKLRYVVCALDTPLVLTSLLSGDGVCIKSSIFRWKTCWMIGSVYLEGR